MVLNKGLICTILVLVFILSAASVQAQMIDASVGSGGGSLPIWGSSPFQNGGADNGMIDPNWGVLPSQQGGNLNMWGQQINPTIPNQQQLLDIYGNPVMLDNNGNVLYDAQGNPMVDSAALLNLQDNDVMGLPPPPDDPIDVPLDGGVGILLIIATGLGYRNMKK